MVCLLLELRLLVHENVALGWFELGGYLNPSASSSLVDEQWVPVFDAAINHEGRNLDEGERDSFTIVPNFNADLILDILDVDCPDFIPFGVLLTTFMRLTLIFGASVCESKIRVHADVADIFFKLSLHDGEGEPSLADHTFARQG